MFISLSCSSNKFSKSSEDLYKIYKIEHINSYYFIYCEKNDVKYKIISKQNNSKLTTKQIIVGQLYKFQLNKFPDYSKEKNPLGGFTPLVNCFNLDNNTEVCRENDINGLYTTKNLRGLYYIK